ncbi:DNA-binding protein [Sinorhizobium sp. GL28]|uniref:DNA-binding protein n=1 Tax=Sinorhizobium sp. GL28 TaxID=1358418 RepID=UPI000B0D07CC|nr:DNA-binding protein [Sinorhizobium sp. GL28]
MARKTSSKARDQLRDDNMAIAEKLREYGDLLDEQGEDSFRSRAYRRASNVVAALNTPVATIVAEGGREALEALPAVGEAIAGAIIQMVASGRWVQLERLRGELTPEVLFRTTPGIGPRLAGVLADDGTLETLEDLEHAIHFGNLALKGIGPRRKQMIASALAERLGRRSAPRLWKKSSQPPIALLLEVDRAYRDKAASGALRLIAPRRLNPTHEAWLPVMHMELGGWHFTVLFSNSRRAHELGKTKDWVVIYHQRDGEPEGRTVVMTSTHGRMVGKRVVRPDPAHQTPSPVEPNTSG